MKNGYLGERDVRLAGSRFPSFDRGAGGEWAAVGRDEQIGKIFRNMRTALKVPRDALARRLATSPEVIDSFEAGGGAPPPPPEENRAHGRRSRPLLSLAPPPPALPPRLVR